VSRRIWLPQTSLLLDDAWPLQERALTSECERLIALPLIASCHPLLRSATGQGVFARSWCTGSPVCSPIGHPPQIRHVGSQTASDATVKTPMGSGPSGPRQAQPTALADAGVRPCEPATKLWRTRLGMISHWLWAAPALYLASIIVSTGLGTNKPTTEYNRVPRGHHTGPIRWPLRHTSRGFVPTTSFSPS